MLLNGKPNLNVEENADFILYCALLSNEPPITLNDLRECNIPAGERAQLASEILLLSRPTNEKIKDLFQQAVGEMGISPEDAWIMTEQEIELAYEGYVHRQELTLNLMILALHRAEQKSWGVIELLENRGYTIGTEQERARVFKNLNI